MIQFDVSIFQRRWLNHQLVYVHSSWMHFSCHKLRVVKDAFAGERHRKEGQGVLVQCPAKVPGEKIASLVKKPFYPDGMWVGTEINTSQMLHLGNMYLHVPLNVAIFYSLGSGNRYVGNRDIDLFRTHSIHGTNGIFTYEFVYKFSIKKSTIHGSVNIQSSHGEKCRIWGSPKF